MDFDFIFEAMAHAAPDMKIFRDEPMKNRTSFRIGGPARIFAEPANEEQLSAAFACLKALGIPPLVIGRGSNLLVNDGGIEGAVIHLGDSFADISLRDGLIYAQAGASLASVASFALKEGLGGMEFAHGIPGSVGGGVMMNAGAYGGELKDIVASVRYMDAEGNILETSDCRFAYRHSRFEEEPSIILGAYFRLEKGEKEAISAKMKELSEKRMASQPLDKPSAGSTFKRPATGYAAAMIDQSGLKGFTLGGAQVSGKHAGFVINAGGASCAEVLELMAAVQAKVYENFGVMLEPEVRII